MTAPPPPSNDAPSTAVTVGNFDGVHLGHRAIVRRARTLVGPAGRVVAEVFEPHPRGVLRPGTEPDRLTSFEHREHLLKHAGVDEVAQLAPTPALLAMTPEQFVDRIVERWNPSVWLEGADFRFGARRAGDIETLRELGRTRGFEVEVIEPAHAVLSDERLVAASSTLARGLVELGRVTDAERVLGAPLTVTGTVIKGDQRGRTIGIPTANVDPDCMLPADGVYAGAAAAPDGTVYPAASHVGPRATFNDTRRVLEAHLVGWDGPIGESDNAPAGYGWPIAVALPAPLRDVVRFDSIDAIKSQLATDIERSREHHARRLANPAPAATPATEPALP